MRRAAVLSQSWQERGVFTSVHVSDPEDTSGPHCFERRYGRSYVDGDFYDAKKIRTRLAEGRLRSIVAVKESGEIVGHMGLRARSSNARTADAG